MRTRSKWRGIVFGATGLTALALASPVQSADHKDAPGTVADPASDINDVFAFVDGGNVVLAMTVTPFAASTVKFSDKTQYVFHVSSGAAFGTTTKDVDIICTFDTAQKISCWAGTADYVSGDASKEAGLASTSGKMKVFAGLRSDPFFFNLQGFKDTVKTVEGAGVKPDGTCPAVDSATSAALVGLLKEKTSTVATTKTQEDDFATASTLAIVISLDKGLVNAGGNVISVWASTNKGS